MSDPDVPTNPLPIGVASDGPQPRIPRQSAPGSRPRRPEADAVSRLRRLLELESSPRSGLQVLVEAVREVIPDVAEASVCRAAGTDLTTVAWTGLLAQELDAVQSELGVGPGLDAVRSCVPVSIENMRVELRWPAFTQQALARGALSALVVPVPRRAPAAGVLSLYSTRFSGLDVAARRLSFDFADLTGELFSWSSRGSRTR
jgi:hypothetical protein